MEKTFSREISYNEFQPVFKEGSADPDYQYVTVKKTVTFKELDQFDREQHDLHFLIMAHFVGGDVETMGKKKKLLMDPRFMKEVTEQFVEEMIVLNDSFRAQDKEILLNDSAAMIALSLWLVPKKINPFFLELMKSTGL